MLQPQRRRDDLRDILIIKIAQSAFLRQSQARGIEIAHPPDFGGAVFQTHDNMKRLHLPPPAFQPAMKQALVIHAAVID